MAVEAGMLENTTEKITQAAQLTAEAEFS